MSLIIAVTFKDFAVIVSDGLLVVIEDERTVVPINDQYCKFSIVGDCNIVVGSTGSKLLNRKIREFCEELAEQHRDDPELFSLLERAAPDELQRLKVLFPTDIEYIDDGKKVNFGGANLFLTGYDASQKRMRCISWVDDCKDVCCQGKNVGYQPHNHVGGILIFGYSKAADFILFEKLDVTNTDAPFSLACNSKSHLDIEIDVKNAIQLAVEAFPKFIGGKIYSHTIFKKKRMRRKSKARLKTLVAN